MKTKINTSVLWPAVILVVALALIMAKPWQTKTEQTVSVSATGTTQTTPSIAKISATIESKNPNLDTARAENEKKTSTIITALQALGIETKDIKTEYISAGQGYETQTLIYPQRPTTTNQQTTTLQITVRNLDNSDEVIQTLTQNGATNLYGPNLTVDDDALEQAKARARDDAVANARLKAKQLTDASGRKLGKVVKIQEMGDFSYPIPMLAQTEVDLKRQASQIQPGQSDVTITIQVDFSLK